MAEGLELREEIRRLAQRLTAQPAIDTVRHRRGTVQSVQTGSVTIRFAGSTTDIPGVRYLSGYTPAAADVVELLVVGPTFFVLGKFG